jgi:uncharacterized protein YjbI with pentapeptide repeats
LDNSYRTRIIQLLASFSRTPHDPASSVPLDNEVAVRVILRFLDPPQPNISQRLVLRGVLLSSTYFEEFRSARIDFTDAKFALAHLPRADLSNCSMEGADLSGATLDASDLSGVHLHRAKLVGAQLISASLGGADLSDADLTGANFTSADLTGVNFPNARIENANFTDALGLSSTSLELACGIPRSPLPADLSKIQFRRCPAEWPSERPNG